MRLAIIAWNKRGRATVWIARIHGLPLSDRPWRRREHDMFGQVMCQVRSHTPGNRALRAGERTDRIEKRAPSAGGEAGQGVGWANSPTMDLVAWLETMVGGFAHPTIP